MRKKERERELATARKQRQRAIERQKQIEEGIVDAATGAWLTFDLPTVKRFGFAD